MWWLFLFWLTTLVLLTTFAWEANRPLGIAVGLVGFALLRVAVLSGMKW
jgi:hypothetical protein